MQGIREEARLVQRRPGIPGTVVRLSGPRGPVELGGRAFVVMAGPCAVESAGQVEEAARAVAEAGCAVLRGGAFKPRTSPYAFQGLGAEGARLLFESAQRNGLAAVTEVMEPAQLPALKRGPAATVEEWLLAAEYLLAGGNDQVVLCERGIRTFETATRNTLDISAVALAKQRTHLPVVVDPSHAAGRPDLVLPLSLAAAAAGADGLLVEVHARPEEALSDGAQALRPRELRELMDRLAPVLHAVGRAPWRPEGARRAALR